MIEGMAAELIRFCALQAEQAPPMPLIGHCSSLSTPLYTTPLKVRG